LLYCVLAISGHVLNHGFARLEELVLRGEEFVVDSVTVAFLTPPLMRSYFPSFWQAFVT
jgi:hypothetical protein